MRTLRIVIADDKLESLKIIQHYIDQSEDFKVEGICRDGLELIEKIQYSSPDLILADINMPKKNGIDAIKECLQINPDLKFIFITGYDDYAVEAFNLSAVDYIVKPVKPVRLFTALYKAKNLLERQASSLPSPHKRLSLKSAGSIYYIPFNDIIFIEKLGKKCFVHTPSQVYETYEGIKTLYERLDHSFFLSHRSYAINLNRVSHITPRNETYQVFFSGYLHHAYISKLKINEFHSKLSLFI
ncbi:LytR/AlgR family response regulator transcription factor [Bacillus sp. SJS]|uniref:LytR/AlgR family response regulator transcription factor n=1 Tax=Bacillus sp. SJS TaxID=1423321 RepID=UPI0004DCFB7E|nr:LytTR family DNA-binding domain-containing protein [Bacillus sp. SJS]KZZ84959.1 DNA-binding response regulator [Bacillus sp. SJS]